MVTKKSAIVCCNLEYNYFQYAPLAVFCLIWMFIYYRYKSVVDKANQHTDATLNMVINYVTGKTNHL